MHANTKFDERLKTKEFDRKIADVVKEKILLAKISYFFKAGVTRKLRILLFRKNLKKNLHGSRGHPPPPRKNYIDKIHIMIVNLIHVNKIVSGPSLAFLFSSSTPPFPPPPTFRKIVWIRTRKISVLQLTCKSTPG